MNISPALLNAQRSKCGMPPLADAPRRKARHTGSVAERKRRTLAALEVLGMTELPSGVEAKLTPGTPNGWEREYAGIIKAMEPLKYIAAYAFEPIRLRVGVGACKYTPDFVCRLFDGRIEITEIKGFRRANSITKVKAAALLYPQWRFRIAKKTSKGWEYEELSKGQKP